MYLDSSVIASLVLVSLMVIGSGVGIKLLRNAMRRDDERAQR